MIGILSDIPGNIMVLYRIFRHPAETMNGIVAGAVTASSQRSFLGFRVLGRGSHTCRTSQNTLEYDVRGAVVVADLTFHIVHVADRLLGDDVLRSPHGVDPAGFLENDDLCRVFGCQVEVVAHSETKPLTSIPMRPEVGLIGPSIASIGVDLPTPLGPITQTYSGRSIVKDTSLGMVLSPYPQHDH